MDKEGVSSRKFEVAIRGLLAVPKEAIQQAMAKTIAEKKTQANLKRTKKKG